MTEITVIKSDLKKALAAHKKFAIQGKNIEGSILSAIHFIIKDKTLTLETTDSTRALVSDLNITERAGDDCDFNLSMVQCSKLPLLKGELNEISIISDKNSVEFYDPEYNSTFKLEINDYDGVFPNISKITPKGNKFIVRVSKKLIKDISAMHSPQGYVDLYFNPKNNIGTILIESNSKEFKQKALLCPITQPDRDSK